MIRRQLRAAPGAGRGAPWGCPVCRCRVRSAAYPWRLIEPTGMTGPRDGSVAIQWSPGFSGQRPRSSRAVRGDHRGRRARQPRHGASVSPAGAIEAHARDLHADRSLRGGGLLRSGQRVSSRNGRPALANHRDIRAALGRRIMLTRLKAVTRAERAVGRPRVMGFISKFGRGMLRESWGALGGLYLELARGISSRNWPPSPTGAGSRPASLKRS
jgi:hypothetical protein